MQAPRVWSAPGGTLGRIVGESRERARRLAPQGAAIEAAAAAGAPPPSFRAALLRPTVAVVAEVKRRSPSKGDIAPSLGALQQARRYVAGGAAAISVLTEPVSFGGDLADLREVSAGVAVPALRKDFIVDPLQVLEARSAGAAAVLLIARALDPAALESLARAARGAGIETLVEVRDEWELERAVAAEASAIGVNNRNLETLEIDPATSLRLIPLVPGGIPAIAESGMSTAEDVARAAAAGADAVLVGSFVSAAPDPTAAVASIATVPRRGRA